MKTKPFLKWAGGKTKFLPVLSKTLPNIINGEFDFIEPFVGGGAVLFWMLDKFNNINNVVINDTNETLINLFKTIQSDSTEFKNVLKHLDNKYRFYNEDERTNLYNSIRTSFNSGELDDVMSSAYFIFLNKTCFNGLYRVNKSGKFNTPKGKYKNPLIYDEANLALVTKKLKKVTIYSESFEKTIRFAHDKSFFYLDPPYLPLDAENNFTSYTKEGFGINEHKKLKDFCLELNEKGSKFILNNSDSTLTNELFKDFNVSKIEMPRTINSDGTGRKPITELLITNF